MRMPLLSAVAVVALLAACQKKAEAPAAPAPAAPAPSAATEPAAEPAAPAAAVAAGFGVTECDTYIQKLTECIDTTVPEAAREQMRAGLEASRSSWQLAASTPEGKAGLAAACTQATDAARTSMAAYGCAF